MTAAHATDLESGRVDAGVMFNLVYASIQSLAYRLIPA
jgi:hypothetical protein